MNTQPQSGWIGTDFTARDNAWCTCKHRNALHSSKHATEGFLGIGMGQCGYCPCEKFTPATPADAAAVAITARSAVGGGDAA